MGGSGAFLASGGFSRQDYITTRFVAGVKVVKHVSKRTAGLPKYSVAPNTCYLHEDSQGNINQLRFYRGRKAKYDIDWGHGHPGLPDGEPHIHIWIHHKNGSIERPAPRLLNVREKRVLNKLIQKIKEEQHA